MTGLHGLLAEFLRPDDLVRAARRAHEEGYRRMDAYSPLPVHGLADAIGFHRTRLPLLVLAGGAAGALGGFALQYGLNAVDYPLDVGGRPLNSWPAFVVVSFELAILVAALTAVLGMFALNGLPRPHHPVFNVPVFQRASRDRFFLLVESRDPSYDPDRTRSFLESLGPVAVHEVER